MERGFIFLKRISSWIAVLSVVTLLMIAKMQSLSIHCHFRALSFSPPRPCLSYQQKIHPRPKFRLNKPLMDHLSCSSTHHSSNSIEGEIAASRPEYDPGLFDDLFLHLFRKKMVEEIGWDSQKAGYDGLIEVANKLMVGRTNSEATNAAVRILRSLFPPFLLDLYRMLITPIREGRIAAIMVAKVTALTCQWLMGPCKVNSIELPDGSSLESGVFVERCKYLEESKCVGICVNTCKLPTQTFFQEYMGIPLLMEPKFSDYSCQFSFGLYPPSREDDITLKEPCLEICPNAVRVRDSSKNINVSRCPKS